MKLTKTHAIKTIAIATGVTACASLTGDVRAQSVDSLLDKLVEKGVLNTQEAKDLRAEADKDFTKAYRAKSGLSDWVNALKINGDFRGRYEFFDGESSAFVDRSRFRYRMRLGVVAVMKEQFEVGLRLASGDIDGASGIRSGTDPISPNQTLQNNASKKGILIDLAYGKWNFLSHKEVSSSVTIGKMENPFVFSDQTFDPDYTPEGIGYNLAYRLNERHTLKLNAGAFVLDEFGETSSDSWMYGGQLRWDAAWSKRVASTLGVAALNIVNEQNLTNSAVPNINRGNTRMGGTGVLANNFNPVIVDAAFTYTLEKMPYYKGAFPIRVGGDYMNNVAADDHNDAWSAGVTFGKAGKKGTWEVGYRYKYLGADSWYEETTDSDFGAFYGTGTGLNHGFGAGYSAGTNVRGHVVRAVYSPFDALSFSLSYFCTSLIEERPTMSGMSRLQADVVWKF